MQQYFKKIDINARYKAEGLEFDSSEVLSGIIILGFGLVWTLMTLIIFTIVIFQTGEIVPILIVSAFVAIGVLLMLYGGKSAKTYLLRRMDFKRAVKNGEVTIGKVIEIDVEKNDKSQTLRMKYTYKDRNGRSSTKLFIHSYINTPPFKLDQDVHVLFYENYAYVLNQYRPMD